MWLFTFFTLLFSFSYFITYPNRLVNTQAGHGFCLVWSKEEDSSCRVGRCILSPFQHLPSISTFSIESFWQTTAWGLLAVAEGYSPPLLSSLVWVGGSHSPSASKSPPPSHRLPRPSLGSREIFIIYFMLY